MMAVPGADDIQLYEPSHKLAYTPPLERLARTSSIA